MFKYVVKKFILLGISLYLVITSTFFLMHLIPGDPFTEEEAIPQEILAAMYRHFHLEEPVYVQYWNYLKGIAVFDFGPSFKYQGRMATDIIREGFPISFTLGLEALFLALSLGIFFGSVAALKRTRWQDSATMIVAVLGISVPNFLLATFLQYLLAMQFDLFPVARWSGFMHTVLPALALAAMPMAFIARLTRSNMVEVLQQDYILTAKSKGLSSFRVMWKHVLRNALLPVVTYLGPLAASILTGSFVVEKIFGIPGLGQWFVLSVTNRDYMLIMAITIFYSFILMFSVFIVDILYSFIDPRIKVLWKKSNS
jgi:oligopeptide transport system permease protein